MDGWMDSGGGVVDIDPVLSQAPHNLGKERKKEKFHCSCSVQIQTKKKKPLNLFLFVVSFGKVFFFFF
jgi:hypothetical protein